MGSAAAWQLAARGARVIGFDAFHPPHDHGSSHGGSRVIRETAFEHPRYVPVVRRAYDLWHALESMAAAPILLPTGALYAGVPSASVVVGSRRSALEHGVSCDEMDADALRARWPAFNPSPNMVGVFERRAGVLRPESCVRALHAAARRSGAELRLGEPVLRWGASGAGAWVETPLRTYEAAHLVLATGPWLLEVMRAAGVEVWVERVVQHWFTPADVSGLLPGTLPIYLWEDTDEVIFYGFPVLDGALKCAVHHRGESTNADTARRTVRPDEVTWARTLLARFLPAAAGPWLRSAVCLYTNTPDGDFVIDRHPEHDRVVLVSACSGIGFKFTPAVGEAVADLVSGAPPRFDLTQFSIARF